MWSYLPADALKDPQRLTTGHRVARMGTVSFVRSGFARVRWDDGRVSDEWAADLDAAPDSPQPGAATGQATDTNLGENL